MLLISKSAAEPQPSTSNILSASTPNLLTVTPVGGNLFALVSYGMGATYEDNADGTGRTLLDNAGAYYPDAYCPDSSLFSDWILD
ncbi:hypothetical protein CXF85_17030 [Colwellia sp. 75C3]|uniref:hypothetical protein n=1 Tax=Colwellia sp. 75C3 TaxID=888425 RepID=UPI000C345CCB|nr:hypothetical protein [Colwellia sp. 75C3]PKG81677.1 hypothetical protein CXF85_17030 [Colwellia sp. 75C3]